MAELSEKIEKLKAHEKSARAMGSIAEANAYKRKIVELQKLVQTEPKDQAFSGVWKCSCGMQISLDINAGKLSAMIGEASLAPHRLARHKLTRIS